MHHALFGGKGFVADLCGAHADLDRVAVMRGGMVCDVNVRDDHAYFHEGLVPVKKTQLNEVVDTRLLEVRQVFGVVHMSLRVQIPVADFGWVEELEFAHGAIIEQEGKSVAESKK